MFAGCFMILHACMLRNRIGSVTFPAFVECNPVSPAPRAKQHQFLLNILHTRTRFAVF